MRSIISFAFITLIAFTLSSCKNQFAYDDADWYKVTTSVDKNPKEVFIDKNRTKCENGKCKAWVKMIFEREEALKFNNTKHGKGPVTLLIKRIDSSIDYTCQKMTSTIISYQLYDKEDELIYSNWPNKPIEQHVQKGTMDDDLIKYLCK